MITVDDYFNEVRECIYKGEHYSVRDNGSVMRHSRDGKRKRKYDNIWTFGVANSNGYCLIGGEVVHRIIAVAFHGEPISANLIVDHIDTNHKNNRPENLRWVTRLENALNNEITRAKIEKICGSIEAFLENPAMLKGHEKEDPNFDWMRAVSPKEAKASLERLSNWAKQPKLSGGRLGEWVYKERINSNSLNKSFATSGLMTSEQASLTPNAIQVDWKTPTEFPSCPDGIASSSLKEYSKRLIKGSVYSRNKFVEAIVVDTAFSEDEKTLIVMCKNEKEDAVKRWLLSKVTCNDNKFYHHNAQSYFEEAGALKYFTIAQGKEWTGGQVFDDLC